MEYGPYYSFINGNNKLLSIYEFYRGKYKIIKKIMSVDCKSNEINNETPIAFLDLILNKRRDPINIENAVNKLKMLEKQTESTKENLIDDYKQAQSGFLYNLRNALIIKRDAIKDKSKFKIVLNVIPTLLIVFIQGKLKLIL